jgi:uncharacterized membrane protein YidH (DUF202 family)
VTSADRPADRLPDEAPDRHPDDRPDEPPGAAGERTALAWQRTALLAMVGCFLLGYRALILREPWLAIGSAALGVALAVGSVIALPLRHNASDAGRSEWPLLMIAAGSVIALGVLGAAAGISSLTR